MIKTKPNTWLFIATICFVLVTLCMLSYIATDPAHNIIVLTGDGGKNYFTWLYHIVYEKGVWFYGMNYPYGDNILFTDAQPLLSIPLSYLHLTITEALVIINLCIVIGYILGMVFIYKTLCYLQVRPLLSIVFASLIIILSPQLSRLNVGHYSLSYTCIIPMILYWLLKYHDSNSLKYVLYIFIAGSLACFLHVYYAAIVTLMSGFYMIGYAFDTKQGYKKIIGHIVPLILCATGIFLLLKLYLLISDPITDRPQNLSITAMLVYKTLKNQVLTSLYSPFWQMAHHYFPSYYIANGTDGYIGLVVIAACSLSMLITVKRLIKKQKPFFNYQGQSLSLVWIFIALAALLLSMGVPFRFPIGAYLYNHIFYFKQFRAIGRFNWIFYYIITIYAAVLVNNWHKRLIEKKKIFWAYLVIISTVSVWIIEASGYLTATRQLAKAGADNYDELFSKHEIKWKDFLQQHHYSKDNFQAVVVFPFFHTGSEKLYVNALNGKQMPLGEKASLQLHLPMINVMLSRNSWSQTKEQIRLIGGPMENKPLLNKINSEPLLLIADTRYPIDPDSRYLLDASDYIGQYAGGYIYACYPERIITNDEKYQHQVLTLSEDMQVGKDSCLYCNSDYYIGHFDNGRAKQIFAGRGAMEHLKSDDSILTIFPVHSASDTQLYEFSVWVSLAVEHDFQAPVFSLEVLDSPGKTIETKEVYTNQSVDVASTWFRASSYFTIPTAGRSVICIVRNQPPPEYLAIDELALRPAKSIIISKFAGGTVMINNHVLTK